jgi:Icc-related predicted phosphoesterase
MACGEGGNMRWLIVSDLHYSLPQFDWLAREAPRHDLVVLAGDALDIASLVDYRAQTLVVRKYLERIAETTKVIVSSGNHDLDAESAGGERIARWIEDLRAFGIAADGDSLTIGDHFFSVCPWWDGPEARARMLAQIDADSRARGDRRWIWIHHAPPRDTQISWSGSKTLGDEDVTVLIKRYAPDLVVSGHVHQSPFVKDGSWVDRLGATMVLNAGHQFGAPPAHIVVQSNRAEAVWLSAMGAQSVRLDAPLVRPVMPLRALPDWFDSARAQ